MVETVTLAVVILFPILMAYTAASDLLTMEIPNEIPAALTVAFPLAAFLTGMPLGTAGAHLGLAVLVLVVAFGLFSVGWIGGGDAKIAAAASLWFGPAHGLEFLAATALYGGTLTVAILAFRSLPLPVRMVEGTFLQKLHSRAAGVPYGIAIAAGALVIFPETSWFAPLSAALGG